MTRIEERLREALDARASTASVDPAASAAAWASIFTAIDAETASAPRSPRSPRRQSSIVGKPRRAAAVGIAVAACAALVFGAVPRGVEEPLAVGPGVWPVASEPDELVAIWSSGAVVVVDVGTGRRERRVTPSADPPDALPWKGGSVDVVPGRPIAYFSPSAVSDGCGAGVFELSLSETAASPALVEANAQHPVVSPDGRRLAYVAGADDGNCAIVVRNLVDGTRRSFDYGALPTSAPGSTRAVGLSKFECRTAAVVEGVRPMLDSGSVALAWSPDSRRIAFVVAEPTAPAPRRSIDFNHRVRVLEVDTASSLADAELVGPSATRARTHWWFDVAWRDADTLWVLGSDRCGPEERVAGGEIDHADPTPALFTVEIDGRGSRDGDGARSVMEFAGRPVPRALDVSASGHLLWVRDGDVEALRDGEPVTVARRRGGQGYMAAAW